MERPGDLARAGRFGSGREIWLWPGDLAQWPGDLALSCNPSYLGGQSSGMVCGGKVSARQPTTFEVRTNAAE
jgi:hypothetical protein